ncbi:MAG: hypothetical protein GY898_30765 [Proteobacteria bacterium]|nr:hypothetical protein [Actinomycetes bacterium]MCP4873097.1 hypothetical protein [Pseudomonadota bacterium]
MARPLRIDFPGARHHVLNRGARRAPIFATDEACNQFVGVVAATVERFEINLHGYALMPNHYHLMVESCRGNLSAAMKYFGGRVTQLLNLGGHDGPVFRGRFTNCLVSDDAYWQHLLLYLHLNPVKAGLVRTADDALWTSHRAYSGLSPTPSWLTVAELLEAYGTRAAYRIAMNEMRIGARQAPEGFDPARLWTPPDSKPAVRAARLSTRNTADAIADVSRVTGVPAEVLLRPPRGPRRHLPATDLAAWWLTRSAEITQADAGELLGGRCATTVSRRVQRTRSSRDPRLLRWRLELDDGSA